jgi:hypothetical protein
MPARSPAAATSLGTRGAVIGTSSFTGFLPARAEHRQFEADGLTSMMTSAASSGSSKATFRCECGFLYDPIVPAKRSLRACRSAGSAVVSVSGPFFTSNALRIRSLPISAAESSAASRTATSTGKGRFLSQNVKCQKGRTR